MPKNATFALAAASVVAAVGWAGQGTGAHATRSISSTPTSNPGSCTNLLLLMRPGMRDANGRVMKRFVVPKSMPRYVVPVEVPVLPGAEPVARVPGYMQAGGVEAIADTKSAVTNYSASEVEGRVVGWYQSRMPACGFKPDGEGGGSGAHQPVVNFFAYSWNGNPDLSVSISFATVGGHTLINYTATVHSYRARPRASYLPYGRTRIWLNYEDRSDRVIFRGAVTSGTDRNVILDALNTTWSQLNAETEHTCLAFGASAVMVVTGRHGRQWTVTLDGSCYEASIATKVRGVERRFAFEGLGDTLGVLALVARSNGR